MAILAGLAALSPARQLVAAIAGPLLLIGVGFGLAEAWERRPPQTGLSAMLGQGLKTQRDRALVDLGRVQGELKAMTKSKDEWKAANGRCEDKRKTENQNAADLVNDRFARGGADDTIAFNNGFSAGDRAGFRRGRASCGVPTDAPATPTAPRPAAPVGVRDDQGPDPLFGSGAYEPGR
jgi:hypothetical protein